MPLSVPRHEKDAYVLNVGLLEPSGLVRSQDVASRNSKGRHIEALSEKGVSLRCVGLRATLLLPQSCMVVTR